jgi:hypothetical protein
MTSPTHRLKPPNKRCSVSRSSNSKVARFEEITGLTFDRETGNCTTPGEVKMEGELKVRWAALCAQLGEAHDAQKIEQLWREAGKFMREAIQQTGTTDGEDRQNR